MHALSILMLSTFPMKETPRNHGNSSSPSQQQYRHEAKNCHGGVVLNRKEAYNTVTFSN